MTALKHHMRPRSGFCWALVQPVLSPWKTLAAVGAVLLQSFAHAAELKRQRLHHTSRASSRRGGAQLLWRYSREAVQMRLRYLQTEQGTEAYTVLLQDIPGIPYGTPLHRLDATVRCVGPAVSVRNSRHPWHPVQHAAAPPGRHSAPHWNRQWFQCVFGRRPWHPVRNAAASPGRHGLLHSTCSIPTWHIKEPTRFCGRWMCACGHICRTPAKTPVCPLRQYALRAAYLLAWTSVWTSASVYKVWFTAYPECTRACRCWQCCRAQSRTRSKRRSAKRWRWARRVSPLQQAGWPTRSSPPGAAPGCTVYMMTYEGHMHESVSHVWTLDIILCTAPPEIRAQKAHTAQVCAMCAFASRNDLAMLGLQVTTGSDSPR